MTDELLPYFERELAFIKRMGAEFAKSNPKIAGRLRISGDTVEDPHVSRLIESFALLNARTRYKLDDDFPELTDSLLSVLYPHYLAPIPSMSVVQFEPQEDLTEPYRIERHTELETEPIDDEPCRFRTTTPVVLWPLEVKSASLASRPIRAPAHPRSAEAPACLRLVVGRLHNDDAIAELPIDSLRFFLTGQPQETYPLLELILNNTIGIALADSHSDSAANVLDLSSLRPVGLERDEGMLDYPAQAFLGYRLLSEYFAFPEKFMFFQLDGLAPGIRRMPEGNLEIFFYLNRTSRDLEQAVSAEMFSLGCAPVINIYRQVAEPIRLTHQDSEYRIVPDARRPKANEIYAIDRVSGVSPDAEEIEFHPFYSIRHADDREQRKCFWQAMRRPAGESNPGSELFLRLIDLDFDPANPLGWTINVETTCFNRDLPGRLPFGVGQPKLQFAEGDAPVGAIRCLVAPTRTLRARLRRGAFWRLVSHLNLNHLSLTGGAAGTEALREILRLYDFKDSAETQAMIDGVELLGTRAVTRRSPAGLVTALSRGIEISLELDEAKFAGNNPFMLGMVLERFFALYGTINSFTQLVVQLKGREGILRRWQPRAGEKPLL